MVSNTPERRKRRLHLRSGASPCWAAPSAAAAGLAAARDVRLNDDSRERLSKIAGTPRAVRTMQARASGHRLAQRGAAPAKDFATSDKLRDALAGCRRHAQRFKKRNRLVSWMLALRGTEVITGVHAVAEAVAGANRWSECSSLRARRRSRRYVSSLESARKAERADLIRATSRFANSQRTSPARAAIVKRFAYTPWG